MVKYDVYVLIFVDCSLWAILSRLDFVDYTLWVQHNDCDSVVGLFICEALCFANISQLIFQDAGDAQSRWNPDGTLWLALQGLDLRCS